VAVSRVEFAFYRKRGSPEMTAICYFYRMKTKECPSCAMQVDAKSKVCPICQYEFTQTNRTWQIVALLLVLLFIYLILF